MIRALSAAVLRAAARLRRHERESFLARNFLPGQGGTLSARTIPVPPYRTGAAQPRAALPAVAILPQSSLAVASAELRGTVRLSVAALPGSAARLLAAPAAGRARASARDGLCRVSLSFRQDEGPEAAHRIGDRWSRLIAVPPGHGAWPHPQKRGDT